jgi:hypothetical protein
MTTVRNLADNLNEHMVREGVETSPAEYVASLSDEQLAEILFPLAGAFGFEADLSEVAAFRVRAQNMSRQLETRRWVPVASDTEATYQVWVITE